MPSASWTVDSEAVAADQIAQPSGEPVAEPVEHRVVDIDMDMDPVTVTAGGVGDGVQGAVGDLDQRLDLGRHDTVALEQGVLGFTERGVDDRAVVGVEFPAQLPRPSSRCHNDKISTGSQPPDTDAASSPPGCRRASVGREVVGAQHPPQLGDRRQLGELAQFAISPTRCLGGDRGDLIQ